MLIALEKIMDSIDGVKVIYSKGLSKRRRDSRYVIVDAKTNKILDDAQGYGYTSEKKAMAAYAYKNRGSVGINPTERHKNVKAVESCELSDEFEKRYIIVDTDTGEVLDDAQGFGYTTPQKAHTGYAYKTRDKSKDAAKKAKQEEIKAWLRKNKGFVKDLDQYAFEIYKGSLGPEDKIDAKFIKDMLKERDLDPGFTAGDILRVWRKM